MSQVIHRPRVAWDGARAFVRAACSPSYDGFAVQVHRLLGYEIHAKLDETREHLLAALRTAPGDRYASDVEAGTWRVRLEDLFRDHPDLVEDVQILTGMATRC